MDDQQDGSPGPKPLDRLADELGARRVEIGGRLVQDHERRVAEEGARERDPLALAGRERPPAFADDGVVALRQRDDEVIRTGARRRRPAPRGRWRRAAPSRMLSATVPRKSVGCCGTQAMLRAPGRRRALGQIDAARRHPPPVRLREPQQE